MYKTLCGLIVTDVSDDANDDMMLDMNSIKMTNSNSADPRNEARNVLKNDFIGRCEIICSV
jgi:hypothetical protein